MLIKRLEIFIYPDFRMERRKKSINKNPEFGAKIMSFKEIAGLLTILGLVVYLLLTIIN